MPLVFIIESAVGLLSAFVLCQAICNIREYNVTLQMMCIQLLWYTFYELNSWIMMEAVVRYAFFGLRMFATHIYFHISTLYLHAPHDSQEECWHDEWWMVGKNVRTRCMVCVWKVNLNICHGMRLCVWYFSENVFPSRITYLFNPELQWTFSLYQYMYIEFFTEIYTYAQYSISEYT